MSTQTPNYGLTKPTYPEPADVEIINGNMDIIDTQMKANEDASSGALKPTDVIDNLTSSDGTKPLSANMGRELKSIIDTNVAKINAKDKTQDLKIKKLEAAAEGELYITDEDSSVAYIKDVDADALPVAMMTKLGGRTIVGNQLVQNGNFESALNWLTVNCSVSVANNIATLTPSTIASFRLERFNIPIVPNHKYYISSTIKSDKPCTFKFWTVEPNFIASHSVAFNITNTNWNKYNGIITTTDAETLIWVGFSDLDASWTTSDHIQIKEVMVVDLTQQLQDYASTITLTEASAINYKWLPHNLGSLESEDTSKIVSYGKNLLPLTEFVNNTGSKRTVTVVYSTPPLLEAGTYTWSIINKHAQSNINFFDENNVSISAMVGGWGITNKTFTLTSPIKITKVTVDIDANTTGYLQIEKGSSATSYSPYKTPIDHPIPQAIQDFDGYGWSAGSVYNEVDFVNKKFIKRVGSVDMGTLGWAYGTFGSGGMSFYANNVPNIKINASTSTPSNILCPRYVTHSGDDVYHTANDRMICTNQNGWIYLHDYYYTDVQAFKQAMQGIPLYYEIATPIETDLSDILTDDFLLEVEGGGTIEFVGNEDYNIPVPSTEVFYLKTV